LKLYLNPEKALRQIPALKMMTETTDVLQERAVQLHRQILAAVGEDSGFKIDVVTDTSQVGGGAYPTVELESRLIRFSAAGSHQPTGTVPAQPSARTHRPYPGPDIPA
jgi:L-seryl-tRNA(Ser) seleniumtransferase